LHDYDASSMFPTGWFVSLQGNVNDWFGVAGELFGNYKSIDVLRTNVNLNVHSPLPPLLLFTPRGYQQGTAVCCRRGVSNGQFDPLRLVAPIAPA
jgi:hypothetical protein